MNIKTEFQVGDYIGGTYRVDRVLGQGGFGTVYLVQSISNNGYCALKVIHPHLLSENEVMVRFQREAQILVELSGHPNIIQTSFINISAGRLVIGMEYIPPNNYGVNNLRSILDVSALDLMWRRKIAEQICHGMEFVFKRGVKAHRDLKPENLLIGKNSHGGVEIKISDFGIAGNIPGLVSKFSSNRTGSINSVTRIGSTIGTPLYASPEQFTDSSVCNEQSDIYSFGVILYELFSFGKFPFHVSSEQELIYAHSNKEIIKFESPFFHIVEKCMLKNRAERYSTFFDIRKDLNEVIINGKTITFFDPVIHSKNTQDYITEANALRQLGDFKKAQEHIKTAIQKDPKSTLAVVIYGLILQDIGEYELALEQFLKSIEIHPNCEAYQSIADLLKSSDPKEALRYISLAIECSGKPMWELHNTKANIYVNLADSENALKEIEKGFLISPKNATLYVTKSVIFSRLLLNEEEAISMCLKAIEVEPAYHTAMNNIAASYLKLGDYKNASTYYEKALTVARSSGVKSKLEHERMSIYFCGNAQAIHGLGRLEEAVVLLNQAIGYSKKNHGAWYLAGSIFHEMEDYDRAFHYLNEAVNSAIRQEDFVKYAITMATALLELSRFDEANSFVDASLKKDASNADLHRLKKFCDNKEPLPKKHQQSWMPKLLKKLIS